MKHKTIILLGGNQPNTLLLFKKSLELIRVKLGRIMIVSSVYESSPWGFTADNNFLNQVAEIETEYPPQEQLSILLGIEKELGRERIKNKIYGSRGIDLDILFIDNLRIETPELLIPHPRLHLRRFALVPLCEHWGNLVHPNLNKDINELLKICKDTGIVGQKS